MSNRLDIDGAALTVNFSVNNKLGVTRNQLYAGTAGILPTVADISDEVNAIFGGDILNLSIDRLQQSESNKAAGYGDKDPERYGIVSVSGTFFDPDNPDVVETFYLDGINPGLGVDQIRGIIQGCCPLPGTSSSPIPDAGVFVGAMKRRT